MFSLHTLIDLLNVTALKPISGTLVHMTVYVVSTGGTIASTADVSGALVPTLSADELVARSETTRDVQTREIASLDSSSMGLADIDRLRALTSALLHDDTLTGLVITHGTDSMAETALALDLVHRDERPVVLTGAMRSADHPHPDGPANLRGAIEVAATQRGGGAFVHFGGITLPARGLRKRHTTDLDAFDVPVSLRRPMPVPAAPLDGLFVPILRAWPGDDGTVAHLVASKSPDGVVVEALGAGNVSDGTGEALRDMLRRGIPVVIATSTPYGAVTFAYGGAGGGSTLGDLGALPAGHLSPGQARIALLTALATGVNPSSLL